MRESGARLRRVFPARGWDYIHIVARAMARACTGGWLEDRDFFLIMDARSFCSGIEGSKSITDAHPILHWLRVLHACILLY